MTNDLVKLQEAVFPDHAHTHRHTGTHSYDTKYRAGPESEDINGGGAAHKNAKKHNHSHDFTYTDGVTIDFAHMSTEETFVTKFATETCSSNAEGCGMIKSSDGNLYPRHMRVKFIFKCS